MQKYQDLLGDCVHNPEMKEHLDSGNVHHFQLQGISVSKQCLHLQAAEADQVKKQKSHTKLLHIRVQS